MSTPPILSRAAWLLALPIAFAACEVGPEPDGPDAANLPDVLEAREATSTDLLTVGEFRGSFDPETGEFEIEQIPFEEWTAIEGMSDVEVQTLHQQLYCNDIVVTPVLGEDAVTLNTVVGSVGQIPADCIDAPNLADWNSLVYAEGGAFCATVQVSHGFSSTLVGATAEITEITSGYEGYEYLTDTPSFCCGNGANLGDTDQYPDGEGKPTALNGGAFGYGDIAAGGTGREAWIFRNAGGSFEFEGRIVARLLEIQDGLDNDCDGIVDNALGLFDDGDACAADADCSSGLCEDEFCANGCDPGFYGLACDQVCGACGNGACNDGLVGDGSCECDTGWTGAACDDCDADFYGATCDACPSCVNDGVCDEGLAGTGACACPTGFHGTTCENSCADGMQNGDEIAIDCGGSCGSCTCTDGILSGDEINVDCGGSCPACTPTETPDPLTGTILIWDGAFGGTVPNNAAVAAGLTPTTYTGFSGQSSFRSDLVAGGWDIVLVDNTDNSLNASTRDALVDWVNGGGALILGHEDLEDFPILQVVLDVSVTADQSVDREVHSTPQPDGFDLFGFPLAVPAFNDFDSAFSSDRGDALATGSGFIAAVYDSAGGIDGAIAVTNDRRTIINGFVPHNLRTQDNDSDGTADLIQLYRNEFEVVLGSVPNQCADVDGNALVDGTACTGASTCASYSCLEGACVGTPLTDGLSCDDDANDCGVSTCESGACVDAPLADCDTCGAGGTGTCAGGDCLAASSAASYDFETTPDGITNGGSADWFVSTDDSNTGASSFRAGDIGNSDESSFTISVHMTAAGNLTFNYRLDAETCCDELHIDVNGIEVADVNATIWTSVSIPLGAGVSNVTFSYEKDGSVSSGADTVYVDDISFDVDVCGTDSCGINLVSGDSCITCDSELNGTDCTPGTFNSCRSYQCSGGSCLQGTVADGTDCAPTEDPNPCLIYTCGAGGCFSEFVEAGATCDVDPFDCSESVCDGAGTCGGAVFDDCTACGADGVGTCAGGVCDGVTSNDLDFETAPTGTTFGGDADWVVSTDQSNNGSSSFASGDIGNSQTSSFSLTVEVGEAATLSFFALASVETCCDELHFDVDGVEVFQFVGSSWTEYTQALAAGTHTLTWSYEKDSSVSTGADTVWVDDITIELGTLCVSTECGPSAWTGSACLSCVDDVAGDACSVADPNPCMAYSCDASGACVGTAVADGSTCDEDATDCTIDTCTAGVCGAVNEPDCASCGVDGQCAEGICDGITGDDFDMEAGLPVDFTATGTTGWTAATDEFNGGAGSIRSGSIGNSQTTGTAYTVTLAADATLSFFYKVSSESCCDGLLFLIDGAQQESWRGTIDWTEHTEALTAGTYTFEWRYTKDSSVSSGSDSAWVDDIGFAFATSCENTECGNSLFNGTDCTACAAVAEGTACTVADANPCVSYSCDASGACAETPIANGTTCDEDATDCLDFTCTDGACGSSDVSDCATCGELGDSQCMAGACGGLTESTDEIEADIANFTQSAVDDADWFLDVANGNTGTASARSGDIDSSQTVGLLRDVTVAAGGSVSFFYSVSSESCCDGLRFFVDGVQQEYWRGTITWAQHTEALTAGTHSLEWRYTKDSSVSTGTDDASIDDFTVDFGADVCEDTVCGSQFWNGDSCAACLSGTVGDSCAVGTPDPCQAYSCEADGSCGGTVVSDGTTCAVDGANPCLAYTCNAGACEGVAVVDGTTCDEDATDCSTDSCSAGVCVQADLSNCATCGDGSELCFSGTCGGLTEFSSDFESGLPTHTDTGAAVWATDTSEFVSGATSARAGTIGTSSTSGMVISVDVLAGSSVTFQYKVSSESCCDGLRFFIDGSQRQYWRGELDWTEHTEVLAAGPHTLEWRYTTDSSFAGGSDTAWIDDLVIGEYDSGCASSECGEAGFNGTACEFCPSGAGGTCTVADPNPCATYTCQIDGSCGEAFVADGTTCDDDPNDCVANTCNAGVCGAANAVDCSSCGAGGAGICANGYCDGTNDSSFGLDTELPAEATASGNLPWTHTTADSSTGAGSIRGGAIGSSQTTGFILDVDILAGDGSVTFDYKVSSEPCCDGLLFLVDGVSSESWRGTLDWTEHTETLTAGAHTLEWRYTKDSSVSTGSDTAWIDSLVITNRDTATLCVDDGCADPLYGGDQCVLCNAEVDGTACGTGGVCDTAVCAIAGVDAPFNYGFDDGLTPEGFLGGGTLPWVPTTAEARTGTHSLGAGAISSSQSSSISVTVEFATELPYAFFYKMDSEPCCDFLTVTLDGASILSDGGLQDWTEVTGTAAAGSHTFVFTYTKDSSVSTGADTAWIDDFSTGYPDLVTDIVYNFDDGAVPAGFALSGAANWSNSTAESNSPANSLQSGAIGNSASSTMTATVTVADTTAMSFQYKVSSEGCCDFLSFSIDGANQGSWGGTVDWTEFSASLAAGTHTLVWTYSKDSSATSGSDAAWIDDLVIGSPPLEAPVSVDFESGVPASFSNGGAAAWFSQATTVNGGAAAMQAGDIADGQTSELSVTVITTQTEPISFFYQTSAETCCDPFGFLVDGVLELSTANAPTWTEYSGTLSAGTHELIFRFQKDGSVSTGLDTAWIDDLVIGSVPVEAPAFYQFDDSADVPLDFSAGGDADWTVSTTESNSGANSLQAGIITNSQDTTTSIEVSFTTPETVGFWYKVSSENCCDGLSFQVDGGTDLLGFVDGEVDWTFFSTTVAAGAHTLSWTYLKDSSVSNGSDTAWIDDLSFGAPVSGTDVEYNFESGVPVQVSNDDTNPWFTTTSTANDGTTSYQSGSITDGEISAFSITVDLPTAETLSFAYAVSSEPCCDFLRLFVDGTQVQSFANTSGVWATHVQALSSGEHTVEWRYTKDGSVSTGLDAAWVDTIVFGTPAIVDPAGYAFDSAADLDDFVLSGGADWFLQGTTTHSGAMAAQSGDIGDSSTSSMTLTVELTGTQTLSFQYQTSTESCCDGLSFLVDGVEVLDDRNEATWAEYTQVLTAGTYELEWQFFKDFSASSGSDAVWIDALTFTP